MTAVVFWVKRLALDCAMCHQSVRLTEAETREAYRYLARFSRCSVICERCIRQIEDRVRSEAYRHPPAVVAEQTRKQGHAKIRQRP